MKTLKSQLRMLLVLFTTVAVPSFVIAQCTDGRVPCSHKCENNQRPACTDARGSGGSAYCTTAAFCRDRAVSPCDSGWTPRAQKCSATERASKGCQDSRSKSGRGYCIRFR
jgi:hypothetical protein